jgi:hypothetical protein
MTAHNVRCLWLEVCRIGTEQGSSSIARTLKELQTMKIEREDWRAFFDGILTSWRKIETMPGNWDEKFKELFTSLFIEGFKITQDPKMKFTVEIREEFTKMNLDLIIDRSPG